MDFLGHRFDVVEHGGEEGEVGFLGAGANLGDVVEQALEDGGDGAVLVADDGDGVVHGVWSLGSAAGSGAARAQLEALDLAGGGLR